MKFWKSYTWDQAQNPFVTICRKVIFSEDSSRAIYEMGNMELIELRQTSATIQCPFLPEACTRRIEHVSMWSLASTQSKYDGPNQNSICSAKNTLLSCLNNYFKRQEKSSHPLAKNLQKSHGCKKRSTEALQIHLYTGPMAKRRSIPRVSIGTQLHQS